MTQSAESFDVKVRAFKASDEAWVLSTWLTSFREHTAMRMVRRMPAQEYSSRWRRVVCRLLERSRVVVVCPTFDEDTILGWCCIEGMSRLHYVHVRREAQHQGMAREMFSHLQLDGRDVIYSHRTTFSDLAKTPETWEHAPWLLIGV